MEAMLWENRYLVIVVIGIIIFAILDWKNFKIWVLEVIVQAKRLAKDKCLNSGKEQEDWVVSTLMKIRPLWIKPFLTEPRLRKIVQVSYRTVKDKLDDGKLNGSIEE